MPGLAGIVSKRPLPDGKGTLDSMIRPLIRGPFGKTGSLENQEFGLRCGWVCEAGSFADCLPLWNESHDVCLLFAGEDFTDRPDLNPLRARGHVFDDRNASYLVHWYEEEGVKFLERLNGESAGLILDLRERKIVLFNDRFGLSRMHFHENDDAFYFASEAKSLLKVLPALRKFDMQSLGEFYSCGCVLQNRTLFAGVSLLPPASAWTFSADGRVAKGSYFQPEMWENQEPLEAADYYEQLKATWQRLLPRYFRGDRVALSLTGGVDSRMILAWAPRSAGSLPCYTFGGRYRDCADVKLSREVARICQQPHSVIPVDGEFLSQFPRLAEQTVYLSDGTMDVTGAIDLYIQRAAREIAPVRVTGTNGGEILRSLVAFKPMPAGDDLFEPEFLDSVHAAVKTYAHELRGRRLSFTAFKQVPWYMCSKFVVERSEVTLRMPYFDKDLVSLVYQAPAEPGRNNDLSLRLIADGNPALAGVGTDRGIALGAMAGVAQARHFLHEFTFKAEYAYDYGMPQWLSAIDHLLAPLHVEKVFLGRHKFHHFRVFYRDELAGYLKDTLLNARARTRPYLRGDVLERMVNGHTRGNRNYTLALHKLLTTELIHRQFLDRN